MNLACFKDLIKQRCGLTFEGIHEAPLLAGLQKRIGETNAKSASAYYAALLDDEHEFHELVCLLTINETYFYREPEQLQLLVDKLIPRMLARNRTPVRILSAGCSTGEEPYSIAIALHEKYGASATRLFTLFGADIDKGALEKARTGQYTEFSFRSLAPKLCERYFERQDKCFRNIRNDLRHQVHFHHLNLLAEHYHHALQDYDLIFFRNVSIYFDLPTRRIIQQHLTTLLNDEGYLIVGTAETMANDLGILSLVEEDGLFYFAKQPHSKIPAPVARRVKDWPVAIGAKRAPPPGIAPAPPVATNTGEALRLIREKRYDQAWSALLPEQHDSTALLLKAYILLQRKDYVAAEAHAQLALHAEPWSVDACVLLGLIAKWRNDATAAVKWFKQASYACSVCWPAHYYLAELYRAANAPEKARRAYRVVLQLLLAQQPDGLAVIPLCLPVAEVRFLCEHQLARLDAERAVAAK